MCKLDECAIVPSAATLSVRCHSQRPDRAMIFCWQSSLSAGFVTRRTASRLAGVHSPASGSAAWLVSQPRKDRTPFTSQQRREAMLASATRVAVAPFRAVRGPSVRRTSRAVSSDAAAGEKFWDKMTKLASGAKDTETAVFALG